MRASTTIAAAFAVLILSAPTTSDARTAASGPIIQFVHQVAFAPAEGSGIFKWEQDLRAFSFRLLKDIRRWSIRLMRLVRRSATYWVGWIARGAALLLFGGAVSAIDRRILLLGWRRGARVALAYAWVGVVVFLRLLFDARVSWRLRALVPIAIVYGIASSAWIASGNAIFDCVDELVVVAFASRWFVRRCPDEIVEQHAFHARRRAQELIPVSFENS
jgi:hypothetical protein